MCFSDSQVNSRQIKDSFKQMVEDRNRYTKGKELSQFAICMLEYMERILQGKVGIRITEQKSIFSCLPCCGDGLNYRNVRKEFQKSYQSCNSKEQLDYYGKFISHLIGNNAILAPFPQPKMSLPITEQSLDPLLDQQLTFDVSIKGKITWTSGYRMKLIPERLTIILKSISEKQTILNLRNYLLRQSKLSREDSYVLIGIVPIQPYKLKFSIASDNRNKMKTIRRIKQLSDKALQQNVNCWKQPVSHITINRGSQAGYKKNVAKLFDKNKSKQEPLEIKKEESPEVKIRVKDINNPLKNILLDKAKVGIIKKTMEYKEDMESRKDQSRKEDSRKDDLSRAPSQVFIQENLKQSGSSKMERERLELLSARQSHKNDNFASTDNPFLRKAKAPLSSLSARGPQPDSPKRKSGKKIPQNFAQQPVDTKSDSHVQQYQRQKLKNASIQRDVDKMDSGKSLANNDIEQMILEQEQFGNLSEISKDSNLSFQTIPEFQK